MKTDLNQQIKEEFDIFYPIAEKIAEQKAKLYIDDLHHQIDELSLDEQLLKIQNEMQRVKKKMDGLETKEYLNLNSKSKIYKVYESRVLLEGMKKKKS